jgi:hypothetical protein
MTILCFVLLAISLIGYFLIQAARANKERVRPWVWWAYTAVCLATIACFVIPRSS